MKKSLTEKANKLNSMYLTDSPFNVNIEVAQENKYFLKFHNTNNLVIATATQTEMEQEIDEILINGVQQESLTFF